MLPLCFPADRCPPVPALLHATTNSSIADQGSVIWYICDQGYGSNNSDIFTSCTADLEWTTAGGICKGTVNHFDSSILHRLTLSFRQMAHLAELV